MKILIFSKNFLPNKGGIQTLVHNLAIALQRKNIKVKVITFTQSSKKYDKKLPYSVIRMQIPSFLKRIFVYSKIFTIVKREKPDFIILGYWSRYSEVFVLIKKLLKIPYAIIIHGKEIAFRKRGKAYKSFFKGAKNANFIIANSNFTKRVYEKLNIKTPAIVINPGLNYELKKLNPIRLREKYYKNDGNLKILFVGRLVERKGADMLIKAIKILKNSNHKIKLTIVGKGKEKEKLIRLIENLNIENEVNILSEVDNENLIKIYCKNDIFVMPSRYIEEKGDFEGFGIVYLEANYFGLPVLGGNSGGIPDAIKEKINGLLCNSLSAENIAEKIIELSTWRKKRPNFHKEMLSFLNKNFNWDKNAERILENIKKYS